MNFTEAYQKMKEGYIVRSQGIEIFLNVQTIEAFRMLTPGDPLYTGETVPQGSLYNLYDQDFEIVETQQDRSLKSNK